MNMYLIKCTKGKNKGGYLAIDRNSGGYPYWSSLTTNCKTFVSLDEAKEYVDDFKRYDYLHDDIDEISIIQLIENTTLTVKL